MKRTLRSYSRQVLLKPIADRPLILVIDILPHFPDTLFHGRWQLESQSSSHMTTTPLIADAVQHLG